MGPITLVSQFLKGRNEALPQVSAQEQLPSTTVTLEIINGPLQGKTFPFTERSSLIVGRESDCTIAVPEAHSFVSRHHCAIEVNPPQVSARDLSSLHGTYVNGRCIGKREANWGGEDATRLQPSSYSLKHGDEIQLGVEKDFRLRVVLSEARDSARYEEGEKTQIRSIPSITYCPVCGRDIPLPMGRRSSEKIVCAQCHANPEAMIRHLSAQEDIMVGLSAIRDYELLQKIGKGGFGAVFLARPRRSNQRVALKVMLPEIATDARARLRFEREIENTRALKHRNVVTLFEEGQAHGITFFTMGYCEAGNVSDLMNRRGGTLSVDEALFLMFQVLDGLHYAHHAPIPRVRLADGSYGPGVGLVHRDIKPCNLLLDGSGNSRVVKVSDYGMSKAFDKAGQTGITRPGSFAGSFHFMPRQQILQFGESLPAVDVWAATATLYYMLTGFPPRDFPAKTDPHTVVLQQTAVPIRQRKASLPKRLARVIDEALVDYPAIGIQDVATLRKRLQGAM